MIRVEPGDELGRLVARVDVDSDRARRTSGGVREREGLGLARIVLALVLIGDLGRRALSAGLWYAEDGPLPSAVYRESPSVLASALLASPGAWSVLISFALARSKFPLT